MMPAISTRRNALLAKWLLPAVASHSAFPFPAASLSSLQRRLCATSGATASMPSTAPTSSAAAAPSPSTASSSPSTLSSSSSGAAPVQHRRAFQPFSEKEETDLVSVITAKPRHVLRHVRQQVWRSRKRELHFRSTVTHLMIVLQDFLRRGQIEPANVSVILEGTLEECVKLSQHDMAHLLFRAYLRFRKYGCRISLDALRALFDSYKGTDNGEMMLRLAQEMSADPEMRALCIAAYLYAGHVAEAEQLRASVPAENLQAPDLIALVHGYDKLGRLDRVMEIVRGAEAFQRTPEELGEVVAAALKVLHQRDDDAAFNEVFDTARRLQVVFPSAAFATILRMRMRHAETIADVARVEQELRALGYVPDLTGNSVIIAAYARMVHFGDKGSEEVMLSKVDTLMASVEARLKQPDADLDVSSAHLRAVLRGYGAAGRPELMKRAWEALQYKGLSNDTRVYNELLKWFCLMGNVKEVLATKAQMAKEEVQPDAHTYTWVLRSLSRFYPRQVDRFYREMRDLRVRPDAALYTTLLGIFGDLEMFDRVEEVRAEMREREAAGALPSAPATYAVLLRVYAQHLDRLEEVWREAQERGAADHEHVLTTVLNAMANHGDAGQARMDEVLRHIPVWPTGVYNVLLNIYGKRAQMDRVEELVEKMRRDGVAFNDVTYGTLVHVYGRAKHADKVAEVMELMKQQEGHIRASFYSVLAATYSRLGDTEGIDEAWEDLMASRLFPDTETYNSFLALYSRHHNVRKMQMVLDSMLRHVPPNPVTSTTVVDMLGKSGRISDMEDLVHDMRRAPETAPTTVTYHQMLNAYAKAGEVAKMERTREEMLVAGFTENAVTFNILADGYGRSRRFEQLGELVARRKAQGVPMEELGYCVLISSYGRARLANEVLRLAGELKAIEDPVDRAAALSRKVLWCLIDALCRCHEVEAMHEWIQALGETSVAERNTLISYYCRCGLMDHAEEMARRIETEDDEDLAFSAFNALAKGHARLGRFDKTVEALHKMRDRNMVPDAATALTLSQLFVRAGLHEQAQQIVLWRRHYARSGQVAADDQEDVIV